MRASSAVAAKQPPRVKFFEALGALADKRVSIQGVQDPPLLLDSKESSSLLSRGLIAKCLSSNGDKTYDVRLQLESSNGIDVLRWACNDNGSRFQGYLGYPVIALMLTSRLLTTVAEEDLLAAISLLHDVEWKNIATKYKNDWDKVIETVLVTHVVEPSSVSLLSKVVNALFKELETWTSANRCLRFGSKKTGAKRSRSP